MLTCRLNSSTAHIISPAVGANFAMYMAKMNVGGKASSPTKGVERFMMILHGTVTVEAENGLDGKIELNTGDFFYAPPVVRHSIYCIEPAHILLFERNYEIKNVVPVFQYGRIDDKPVLPVHGEVFKLRTSS